LEKHSRQILALISEVSDLTLNEIVSCRHSASGMIERRAPRTATLSPPQRPRHPNHAPLRACGIATGHRFLKASCRVLTIRWIHAFGTADPHWRVRDHVDAGFLRGRHVWPIFGPGCAQGNQQSKLAGVDLWAPMWRCQQSHRYDRRGGRSLFPRYP
jgi:hypothetical protein